MRGGFRGRGWLWLLACAGLVVLGRDFPARWLVIEDAPRPVDAVVVLAGDPNYERTASGAMLVRGGMARLLILTGGEAGPGDSAESLRAEALAWGVSADRILMETTSHSTRTALLAVGPLLRREKVQSIALVTSPYHQRRASLAARRALPGIAIVSRPAKPSSWAPRGWWQSPRSIKVVVSEYSKLLYYALRGWV